MRSERHRFRWQAVLVLLAFALLICVRMPEIILKGRFWAEEGKYFLHNAWTMPPLRALLEPVGGYLNIVANASLLLASRLLPLQYAPYLTIAIALAVQLLPPLLILSARDAWLASWPARLAAVLAILLVPNAEEIWLQTLHCQFELTLCCAIILCLDAVGGRVAAGRLLILFVAPLCGPGAIALVPLFGLRLLVERNVSRFWQCAALSLGGAIQVSLFMSHAAGRAYTFDPEILLCVFAVRHVTLPFLGSGHAERLAVSIRRGLATGHAPVVTMLLPLLVFGGGFGLAFRSRGPKPGVWLLLSGVLIATLSYYGAIGRPSDLIDVRFGERYAFVPGAMFSLALIALARTSRGTLVPILWCLVCWQLVNEAGGYRRNWALVADGPAWRSEVAAWRADPSHPLQLWPEGWSMTLPPR